MQKPTPHNPLITLLSMMVLAGLAIIGFIALSYLLIAIAAIGLIMFIIGFTRAQWMKRFGGKTTMHTQPKSGRVIDHDEH